MSRVHGIMQGISKLWRRFWQWRQPPSSKASRPEGLENALTRSAQTQTNEKTATVCLADRQEKSIPVPDQGCLLGKKADQQAADNDDMTSPATALAEGIAAGKTACASDTSSLMHDDSPVKACTNTVNDAHLIQPVEQAQVASHDAQQHAACMDNSDNQQQTEQGKALSDEASTDQSTASHADTLALQEAQQELISLRLAQREADIEAALNMGLTQGKIVPAVLEYHRAQCRVDGGLQRFLDYCQVAPVIAGPSGLENALVYERLHNGNNGRHGGSAAFDPTQRHICQCLGISENELQASANPANPEAF